MTEDNKEQKLSDSTEPAIAYTPCYKPFFERGDFYNEDCNDTIAKLNDNSVDLVFTSPPYYNAREYSQYKDVADYMAQMEQVFLGIERILYNQEAIRTDNK